MSERQLNEYQQREQAKMTALASQHDALGEEATPQGDRARDLSWEGPPESPQPAAEICSPPQEPSAVAVRRSGQGLVRGTLREVMFRPATCPVAFGGLGLPCGQEPRPADYTPEGPTTAARQQQHAGPQQQQPGVGSHEAPDAAPDAASAASPDEAPLAEVAPAVDPRHAESAEEVEEEEVEVIVPQVPQVIVIQEDYEEAAEDPACTFCYHNLVDSAAGMGQNLALGCGHTFHRDCILAYVLLAAHGRLHHRPATPAQDIECPPCRTRLGVEYGDKLLGLGLADSRLCLRLGLAPAAAAA